MHFFRRQSAGAWDYNKMQTSTASDTWVIITPTNTTSVKQIHVKYAVGNRKSITKVNAIRSHTHTAERVCRIRNGIECQQLYELISLRA